MPQHRLYHADCMDVIPRIADESLDIVVTSPPYNLKKAYGEACKDNMPRADYMAWTQRWLKALLPKVKPATGHLFLNVSGKPTDPMIPYDVLMEARAAGWVLQNPFVWVKSIAISDRQSFGHLKPINSERFTNDVIECIWHLTPTGNSPIQRKAEGVGVAYQDQSNATRWNSGSDGRRCAGNAWFIPYKTVQGSDQKEHPCPYPMELPLRCMRLAGVVPEETWVYDPFMGRGTTGEAAAQLGANFAGSEMVETWYHVAEANMKKAYEA